MEGHVYILYSSSADRYYVGSTTDVTRRISEHNRGKNKSTRYGAPWQMKFYKTYKTLTQARKIEFQLKKFKSRKIIEKILEDGDIRTGH